MSSIDHSLAGIVRGWAESRPDSPCLTCDDDTLTWQEFHARCCRVGYGLRELGVRPQDRVIFLDRNCAEYFEIVFGASMAGAVTAAVNWRLVPREILEIINQSGAKVLFVGVDFLDNLEQIRDGLSSIEKIVVIGDDGADGFEMWLADQQPVDPHIRSRAGDTALQLYTSGTTGTPKGVMFSNDAVRSTFGMSEVTRVTEQSKVLVAMPLFHSAGSSLGLMALSRGGHCVVARDAAPALIMSLVEKWRITVTTVVPAVLKMIMELPDVDDYDVSSLDTVVYAGSPVSPDLLRASLDRLGCRFVQIYGLTETQSATFLAPEDHLDPDHPERMLSAGKALTGVVVRVVDRTTGTDCDEGAVGEVWVKAPTNTHGYWGDLDQTRDVLTPDGFIRSGDGGYLCDGYLYLRDRIKDMIVSGAENVYPIEVENVLMRHPDVRDVAVIGVPSDRWGETVKAIVVTARPVQADALMTFARENLAGYKCPTSVDFVQELPRNPSGKLLKRLLREPFWEGRDRTIG